MTLFPIFLHDSKKPYYICIIYPRRFYHCWFGIYYITSRKQHVAQNGGNLTIINNCGITGVHDLFVSLLNKSLIKMIKIIGPNMQPFGTPWRLGYLSENRLFNLVVWKQLEKLDWHAANLLRRISWHTHNQNVTKQAILFKTFNNTHSIKRYYRIRRSNNIWI